VVPYDAITEVPRGVTTADDVKGTVTMAHSEEPRICRSAGTGFRRYALDSPVDVQRRRCRR
jgi:hypothetical protein